MDTTTLLSALKLVGTPLCLDAAKEIERLTAAAQIGEPRPRGVDENGEWEGCGIKEQQAIEAAMYANAERLLKVGNPPSTDQIRRLLAIIRRDQSELKQIEAATIERCAQVAEKEGDLWSNDGRAITEIAAAIRKLKNEI